MLSVVPSVDDISGIVALIIVSPSRTRPRVPLGCPSKYMAYELAAEGQSAAILPPHKHRQQQQRRKKEIEASTLILGAAGWQSSSVSPGDIAVAELGESNATAAAEAAK
jgi:hypothetical protein